MNTNTETTPAIEITPARKFETAPCGRCGGSGHYSYCPSHGTICFGCGGTGRRYTKRGFAARQFYEALCMVEARDIIMGNAISTIGVTMGGDVYSKMDRVTEIKIITAEDSAHSSKRWEDSPEGAEEHREEIRDYCDRSKPVEIRIRRGNWIAMEQPGMIRITTKIMCLTFKPTELVRVAQCREARAAKMEMACDYQDTLTKTGKPKAEKKRK